MKSMVDGRPKSVCGLVSTIFSVGCRNRNWNGNGSKRERETVIPKVFAV